MDSTVPASHPKTGKSHRGTSGKVFSMLHFLQHCMHAQNTPSDCCMTQWYICQKVSIMESFHSRVFSFCSTKGFLVESQVSSLSCVVLQQPTQGPCPETNRDQLFSPLDACPPCCTGGQLVSTGMWCF